MGTGRHRERGGQVVQHRCTAEERGPLERDLRGTDEGVAFVFAAGPQNPLQIRREREPRQQLHVVVELERRLAVRIGAGDFKRVLDHFHQMRIVQ